MAKMKLFDHNGVVSFIICNVLWIACSIVNIYDDLHDVTGYHDSYTFADALRTVLVCWLIFMAIWVVWRFFKKYFL